MYFVIARTRRRDEDCNGKVHTFGYAHEQNIFADTLEELDKKMSNYEDYRQSYTNEDEWSEAYFSHVYEIKGSVREPRSTDFLKKAIINAEREKVIRASENEKFREKKDRELYESLKKRYEGETKYV